MWTLMMSSLALACAGFVHEDGLEAESDASEVILRQGDETVQVEYLVRYEGNAESFGWLVPIYGDFIDMEDGDESLFDSLRELTQPVVVREESPLTCNLACAGKGSDSRELGVDIVAEGWTGTYEYVVIDASDGTALTGWLDDNGWVLGDTAQDVATYGAESRQMVAVRLQTSVAETPEEGRTVPPIRITYAGNTLAFPARMALHASLPTQRTTIYVLAEDIVGIASGWTQDSVQELSGSLDQEATEVWLNYLGDVGAEGGYSLTASMGLEDAWLTRFDTYAPREVHTSDVLFQVEGGLTTEPVPIYLSENGGKSWMFLPGLAFLALVRRRRQ